MIKHIINSVIRKGYWFNNVSFDGCSRLIKYKVFKRHKNVTNQNVRKNI